MSYELYLESLILGLSVALGVSYFRRRKWQRILNQPAAELYTLLKSQKRKPRWLKTFARELDQELNLDQKALLFEVLHRHFKTRDKTRPPTLLSLALKSQPTPQSQSLAGSSTLTPSITDEEKVSAFMSAQSDPALVPSTDTFAQHAILNLLSILKGKKNFRTGLEHAVLDSFAPSGGIAGAKLGSTIGLALAPLFAGITAFLIPIWAILGAWLGALAGKQVSDRFKRRRYFSATKRLRKVSREFRKWFLKEMPSLMKEQERQFQISLKSVRQTYRDHQALLVRMIYPGLMSVFLKAHLKRLKSDHLLEHKRLEQMRAQIQTLDPLEFAALLKDLEVKTVQAHPKLLEYHREYQRALKDLENVRDEIEALPAVTSPRKRA